jgi:hypothetical protein
MENIDYNRNVFLNCPFDDKYKEFFNAAIFAITDCGFNIRCALEKRDASQVRIQKIYEQISSCKFGIHDLSRTQLDEHSQLPRFNMPLELGIFLGAKFLGDKGQKEKVCLVFDEEPYRYQMYLSDISGQDINSHHGEPSRMVSQIRDWLAAFSDGSIPSGSVIWERYERFKKELKGMCKEYNHKIEELTYLDYVKYTKEFTQNKSDILQTGLKTRWNKAKVENPLLPIIREAVEGLDGSDDSFAILTRSGCGLTYIQVHGGVSVGFHLEYQEGSIDEHFECINELSQKDVVVIFQAYSNRDESWKINFRWKKHLIS